MKCCSTLDNGKLRMRFVIPARQKVLIGDALGSKASTKFKELHIVWRNYEKGFSRMDLIGYDAITKLAEKKGNYQAIIIKEE